MLHLISREQAKAAGLKKYFTGQPCKYNQYAERRTSNKNCICFICAAKIMAASKEIRNNNLDQYRERQRLSHRRSRLKERLKPSYPVFVPKEALK